MDFFFFFWAISRIDHINVTTCIFLFPQSVFDAWTKHREHILHQHVWENLSHSSCAESFPQLLRPSLERQNSLHSTRGPTLSDPVMLTLKCCLYARPYTVCSHVKSFSLADFQSVREEEKEVYRQLLAMVSGGQSSFFHDGTSNPGIRSHRDLWVSGYSPSLVAT